MFAPPPPPAEVTSLLTLHAHRRPEKAWVVMPGDGGVEERLPFLLGNPTATCDMPAGEKASSAWAHAVSVTLHVQTSAPGDADRMAAECVLYPPAPVYATWCERWPALPTAVMGVLRRKLGAALDIVEVPALDDVPPEVAACLEAHPHAVWRRVRPRDHAIDVVIDAAPAPLWRLFSEALKKPGAAHWTLVRDMAISSVRLCNGPPAELFALYPGLAVLVVAQVGQLAGIAADADLGEW